MEQLRDIFDSVKKWLSGLSFKTGVFVLASCLIFYGLSFAAFLLPVPYAVKGVLWAVFFGMAKTAQYSGLLILGKAGIQRVKAYLSRGKQRGSK